MRVGGGASLQAGHAVSEKRLRLIRSRLETAFDPDHLELVDESHRHRGHAGAADGRGHFRVRIVSSRFRHIRPLQRQRMVFEALGDLMQTDIHALSISAQPPAAGETGSN